MVGVIQKDTNSDPQAVSRLPFSLSPDPHTHLSAHQLQAYPSMIDSNTPMVLDMVSTLAKMDAFESDKPNKSTQDTKLQSLKEYQDIPSRILDHIQVLKTRLLQNAISKKARTSFDSGTWNSYNNEQEDIELGLKACPLLQTFWNTQCRSDGEQAYCKKLSILMEKSQGSLNNPSSSSGQQMNMVDALLKSSKRCWRQNTMCPKYLVIFNNILPV